MQVRWAIVGYLRFGYLRFLYSLMGCGEPALGSEYVAEQLLDAFIASVTMIDPRLRPPGLNETQLQRLIEHVNRGQLVPTDQLLQAAYEHLDELREARMQGMKTDLATAEAIVHTLDRLASDWDTFSPSEQSLLRGAIRYFSKNRDEIPDSEEHGLEDDVEVLNACFTAVHRTDLVVDRENHPTDS